jgi:hypothetical protein
MTNSSKVLIYLTLLYFIFYCILVIRDAKENLAKSNKSELWNHLSYMPFRGEEPNFQEQLQNFEVAASKFNIDHHLTSTTSKGPSENFKKMSWEIPVSPIDAKNSIGFFVPFSWGVSLVPR